MIAIKAYVTVSETSRVLIIQPSQASLKSRGNPTSLPHVNTFLSYYDVRNVIHHRGNLISGTMTRRIIFAIPTKHKWLSLHSLQYSSFIRCHNPWMAGMACRDCTLLNVASKIKSIYCIISSSPEFSQNWSLSWEPRPLLKMVWQTHCVFFLLGPGQRPGDES